MKLRVGTRRSKLALSQTEEVISQLLKLHPDLEIQIIPIETKGDKIHHKPLREVFEGGKLAFTSELHKALEEKEVDIAVHSLKDIAGNENFDHTKIAAYLERKSSNDLLITKSHEYNNLKTLPKNFVIGTVSLRRRMYILKNNSQLIVKNLRGNIETRIAKLRGEHIWQKHNPVDYDGIIMAESALSRNEIDISNLTITKLSKSEMLPAAGQGTICVEARADDNEILDLISKINHEATSLVSKAERAFLKELNGNCHTAIGVYAELIGEENISIEAEIFDEETIDSYSTKYSGDSNNSEIVGKECAYALKNQIILEKGKYYLKKRVKILY